MVFSRSVDCVGAIVEERIGSVSIKGGSPEKGGSVGVDETVEGGVGVALGVVVLGVVVLGVVAVWVGRVDWVD